MKRMNQTPLAESFSAWKNCHLNLSTKQLTEKALRRKEGVLTPSGALAVTTGKYTGRSPKDKFIVKEPETAAKIDWGNLNQPISEQAFKRLYQKVVHFLHEKEETFLFQGFAGASQKHRLPIQVVTENAWHNLFARQLFIRPQQEELHQHESSFTVVSAPSFKADPQIDGTNSEAFVIISFQHRIVLIGGTEYAGEIKKSIFSVMNYLLPEQNVLSMHCSANIGSKGDTALFFGLSGTGKTTLSADAERELIGDDEHGWSSEGIFNIEGGCYAKCANLSEEKEPQIYQAIRDGAVLENVVISSDSGLVDFDDTTLTENTRAAYAIDHIENSADPSTGGHPETIIFLTADAFGVLPPISKLTDKQAMYHFLSGYTSKLAGTERGITSPEATFSACFGSPFLPLNPSVYAEMLGEKISNHDVNVFLVNTGWTGGGYGQGNRIKLAYTRAMVQAALNHELDETETVTDPIFGLHIPVSCPGVPSELLQPQRTWPDEEAYEKKAKELAVKFQKNFSKFSNASPDIRDAGPIYRLQ